MSHRGTALLLALLLPPLTVTAGPSDEPLSLYQVELVIFARNDLSDAAREVWPSEPGRPEYGAFRELEPMAPPPPPAEEMEMEEEPGAGTETAAGGKPGEGQDSPDPLEQAWQILPAGEHRLADAVARLERSGRYRILFHEAWRQPVAGRDDALPIRLTGGEEEPPLSEEDDPDLREPLSETRGYAPLTSEALELEEEREAPPPLEGVITISRGRYLHLQTDLLYHLWLPAMTENDGSIEERRIDFRMRQHRRMRSREIHYLDHPVLGIIVLFTPWEPGREGTAAEGTASGPASRQ